MESPVCALPGAVGAARHLHEAVVEGEVVAQRVLPALRVAPVVREPVRDEPVDLRQRQHALRRTPNRHRRQGNVRVRRLLIAIRFARRSRHGHNPERQTNSNMNLEIKCETRSYAHVTSIRGVKRHWGAGRAARPLSHSAAMPRIRFQTSTIGSSNRQSETSTFRYDVGFRFTNKEFKLILCLYCLQISFVMTPRFI